MILESVNGYLFLVLFWSFSFASINFLFRRKATSLSFLVSERSVGLLLGTVTTAISWVWAGALFVSSQKAYEQGIPGLFWFTFPNALALIIFSFLAGRMHEIFGRGFTLPEFIGLRFDQRMRTVYIFTIFASQCYAVIFNLTAALLMLNLVTGISKPFLIVILGLMMISLSVVKGIRSSLVEDTIKACLIGFVALGIIPFIIYELGGFSALIAGSGGAKGVFTNLFDPKIAWTFGVPVSVSLISGIIIDQQQWQRAFSMRSGVSRKAFFFGGFVFAIAPIMLGALGFLAANKNLGIPVKESQLAGFSVAVSALSSVGIISFTAMVLAGLVAAGSSALSAISSIGAIDVFKLTPKIARDRELIFVSRISMLILALVGMSIALIPAIQLLYLLLLIGVLRSSLLVPTLLSLWWPRLSSRFTFIGILIGIAVGIPLFVYGSIVKNATISSVGALVPISITLAACALSGFLNKKPFDFRELNK